MLRSLVLLALAFVPVSLVVASPAALARGGDTPGDRDGCVRGRMAGGWNLPDPTSSGRARGMLIASDGSGTFVLRARLEPRPSPGPLSTGVMRGVVAVPSDTDGEEPKRIGVLHGGWVAGPDGRGRFEALVVRPAENEDDPPVRIGRLRGRFLDDGGPDEPGRFQGVFVLCP